ncbi:MAG TPA: ABC transporter permease [Planctomycetaceae bacterium]
MLSYPANVWRYRYFWGSLVRMDIRTRYRGSWLGAGWSLLHPLAMSAAMCLVFPKLFGVSVQDFLPTVISGMVFWQFLSACAVGGCNCLTAGEAYLRQVPAPMAIYPLRTALGAGFHLSIAFTVVLLGNAAINGLDEPASVLALLPTFPLLLLFGWSLAVLAGFAHAYFPDMHHLIEIGMQILFYATPIIYPPRVLRDRGMGWLMDYNPVASLVEVVREPLLGRGLADASAYATAGGLVVAVAALAALVLNRFERKVIFQL